MILVLQEGTPENLHQTQNRSEKAKHIKDTNVSVNNTNSGL